MDENVTNNFTIEIDCYNFLHPNHPLSNPYFQCGIYTMYALIFIVAFIGNGFVCYIVLSSPRMRTVTNYFIMNLAVGDMLITILCVPFTSVSMLKQYWPFGSLLCPVVNYSQALSVFVSAYTLVAISIDKYMVIMWPLKPRISKRFATSIIALVWLIAGITVLPTGTFAKVYQPNGTLYEYCDRYICREDYSKVGIEYGILYSQILMVMQYVIPSIVLLFSYTSIATVIWCHRIPGEAENSRDKRIARSKRKMIKMMVIVVLVYSICWLPYNILMIINESISEQVMMYIYFPLHGLAMSHACYNPIIYCFMNTRFRDGLLLLLGAMPCLNRFFNRTTSTSFPHTGIGLEAAKDFATRGARVILACRDEKKASEAKDIIINQTNNHNIEIGLVNFASLQSVREFAKSIIATEERLDILVNNAGVAAGSNKITSDGMQLCMQVNYFGPVLLTLLLIDLLKKCSPSRIINVSSMMAGYATLTPENLNTFAGPYMAYNNSKLGNILFTSKLAKLLEGTGVSVFSLHPGAIRTLIFRKFTGIKKALLDVVMLLYFKNPEEGAQTTLHAALQQGLEQFSGSHLDECQVIKPYKTARNAELEQIIWEKTIKLLRCEEIAEKLVS